MFKKTTIAALVAAAGLAASQGAVAQATPDTGFFAGISLGQSDIGNEIAIPAVITSGSVDGKDTAFKLYGGYMFSRNFGAELSYVKLGDVSYSGSFFGLPVTGGTVETSGFNISAIGAFPINPQLSLFGKVGFFMWEADFSDRTNNVPFSATADGTDLSFGLGVNYNFTRNLGVRAEWERLKVEDADADLFSVGLVYRF